MRSRRHEADENHCLVDFLSSEGIFNFACVRFCRIEVAQKRAITRGRGDACGEDSQKFVCGSLGSFGDDRRRLRIICRNPAPTRPRQWQWRWWWQWQWEVFPPGAGKEAASSAGSFLVCREPPVGGANRVTPGNPPATCTENRCHCHE